MATYTMASENIGKHFITAFLLTNSLKYAEAAVLDGAQYSDLDRTAASAIRRAISPPLQCVDEGRHDVRAVASRLPAELRRVLQLAPALRRYFVLRMLVGMSRERCAALLKVEVAQVDQGTCMAVAELARIAQSQNSDSFLPLSSHLDLNPRCAFSCPDGVMFSRP